MNEVRNKIKDTEDNFNGKKKPEPIGQNNANQKTKSKEGQSHFPAQMDSNPLPAGEYYATVLQGREDKKKQFGDILRLQISPKVKEEFDPFRAKDGSLSKYEVGTILRVRITPHPTNRKSILSFEVIEQISGN